MTCIFTGTLLLLAGALLSLVLPDNKSRAWSAVISQMAATLFVLHDAVPIMLGRAETMHGVLFWSEPVGRIDLQLDSLGAYFLAFSLPMTLLGTVYAIGYLAPYFHKQRNGGTHFALLNMVSLSYLIVYTVENAMAFLLGWEVAALAAWLLVIWDYKNQKIRFAGFNYLVSTHLSLLFLIAAFMIMHSATQSFRFEDFQKFLHVSSRERDFTFLLLMTSFGLKSAFFPFHTWLPRAHSAAPAHVSALMSGVIHKAGLFGMLKFTLLMGTPEKWMGWYLIGFSMLSACMGVLYTASQRDLKRLLGYSSTENVGIAGLGFGVGYLGLESGNSTLVVLGFAGGILHVVNHALFKCLLFYAAGSVYRMTHTVDLERLGGLSRKMPWTSGFFLLGGLAISAVPPFNGFVSEFLIYFGLFQRGLTPEIAQVLFVLLAAVLAMIGATSALSMTRAYGLTFLGVPKDEKITSSGEAPGTMLFTMIVHAVGVVAIGFAPVLGLTIVQPCVEMLLELLPAGGKTAAEIFAPAVAPLLLINKITLAFVVVCVAIYALRMLLLPRANRRHFTWGCGYTAPNSRMQYTGTSFSWPFLAVFRDLLAIQTREELPQGPFPKDGSLNTHYVDSVERRIFKSLGDGESLVQAIRRRLSFASHSSFAVGLFVMLILVALVLYRIEG